jgi:hypothetical protein
MVTKFAMYWNSNAQDNWTKNERFVSANALDTIEFSKSHINNLMRKHYTSKQENTNLSVFLV